MIYADCGRRGANNVTEITRVTGHNRKTVSKYLRMDDFTPEALGPRPKAPSKPDPFMLFIAVITFH